MTNERLRHAMVAAHTTVEAAASAIGVDPKTVQRWLKGRVPHRRHRWRMAEVLGHDDAYLWPGAGAHGTDLGDATAEVVAAYAHRIQFPLATWRGLIDQAANEVDILGYAVLFLVEQNLDLLNELQRKAATLACVVRIALGDPDSLHVRERDHEEGMDGGLQARIRTTFRYLGKVMDDPAIQVRTYNAPLYNSIFRFDDNMLVTPHLYAMPGQHAPILHLCRLGPSGVFETFQRHFEAIWEVATAPQLPASPVKTQPGDS